MGKRRGPCPGCRALLQKVAALKLVVAFLWRKSSFGTQSARASRSTECMLSMTQTLNFQRRGVLDFVERSIRAQRCWAPCVRTEYPLNGCRSAILSSRVRFGTTSVAGEES